MTLDVDALVRDALRQHAAAVCEAGDPTMSPWSDDPDGGLSRFSCAITEVLNACRDAENEGAWKVPREVRIRLGLSLGVIKINE